jgi:hypothetical protein
MVILALVLASCTQQPQGRYQLLQATVRVSGETDMPRVFRIDTQTGKTWVYNEHIMTADGIWYVGWMDASFEEKPPGWDRYAKPK